ncbi:hypothetical protein HMPREF1862_01724 [Varibaculum cambriense]|uniref:Glycosyltransferase RgtA/B/C/D-like domain-containing protein n=1 Tax=Varibaculum cambriense TaxID=184870 RepID=A0AB34WXN4_9ACTO|nr:DUF6541 family protein [Varibaculum cambriense]KXB79687.1 hypothetical protein HMPREF1862_01724 [Varibaculum cambriense]
MDVLEIASVNDFFNSWLLFLIPLSVSLLVIFLPGLLLGYALELRGRWLWGWAPVGSVGLIVVSAIIASKSGFKWGFPVLLFACITFVSIFWAIFYVNRRVPLFKAMSFFPENETNSSNEVSRFRYLPTILLVVIFIIEIIHFALVVKVPGAFAQIWDNLFHSNLAMLFLQSGDASTLRVNLWNPGSGSFYPAAWHGIVSLIASTCSGAVTVATNALTVVVAFLVWPLGIFCLASAFSESRVFQLTAVFISVMIPQFPYAFMSWGPLYPNLLSSALLPSVIALLIRILRRKCSHFLLGLIALLWGVGGIAASQPNNVFTLVIIAAILIWWFGGAWILRVIKYRNYSLPKGSMLLTGWTLSCIGGFILWDRGIYRIPKIKAMRAQNPEWLPQGSYWSGIKEIIFLTGGKPNGAFTVYQPETMFPIAALFLLGLLVLLLERKNFELLVCWLPFAVLALVGHAMQNLRLRQYLVGLWYADSPRLYVPVAIFSILIASVGFSWLALQIWERFSRRVSRQIQTLFVTVALVISVTLIGNPRSLQRSWEWIGDVYSIHAASDTYSGLVDQDELNLFLQLPHLTPVDSVILGNPWEGAAFAWALGQRRTMFPTLRFATSPEPGRAFLANQLYEESERRQICSFLKTKNVYVLNLRDVYSGAEGKTGIEKRYPSFDQTGSHLLTPVKSVGEARLYKYRGCYGN